MYCEYCNGTLNKLGILGNREHYNCQQCGMETSIDLTRIKFNDKPITSLDDINIKE